RASRAARARLRSRSARRAVAQPRPRLVDRHAERPRRAAEARAAAAAERAAGAAATRARRARDRRRRALQAPGLDGVSSSVSVDVAKREGATPLRSSVFALRSPAFRAPAREAPCRLGRWARGDGTMDLDRAIAAAGERTRSSDDALARVGDFKEHV